MGNDNFDTDEMRPRGNRRMAYLYLVVGAFVIALLIWLFTANSSDEAKVQEQDGFEQTMQPNLQPRENTTSIGPASSTPDECETSE